MSTSMVSEPRWLAVGINLRAVMHKELPRLTRSIRSLALGCCGAIRKYCAVGPSSAPLCVWGVTTLGKLFPFACSFAIDGFLTSPPYGLLGDGGESVVLLSFWFDILSSSLTQG